MHTIFYFWMATAGLSGLWALWTYGFRPLILDRFRFEVECLLAELRGCVQSGFLPEESAAYRTQKAMLEGLIEIAPKFGLLQLLMASRFNAEQRIRGEEDPTTSFESSIQSLQPYTQEKLRAIRDRVTLLAVRFVLLRAPIWMALAYSAYFVGYITGRIREERTPAEALQREAYFSGLRAHSDKVFV